MNPVLYGFTAFTALRLFINEMKQVASRIIKTIADIIFPVECVGCGQANEFLCSSCASKIKIIPVQTCHYCRKPQPFGKTCDQCANKNRLDGLFILGPYDQPILKEAIHAWKHERVKEIGNILGLRLANLLAPDFFKKIPTGASLGKS